MLEQDQQALKRLLEIQDYQEEGQPQPISHASAFLLHLLFKAIPLGLFMFRGIFAPMLTDLLVIQLIFIFIVIDFWVTKNINGRRMIGIRWFFDDDQFGTERFKFECRANQQYAGGPSAKLFWLVLIAYIILPVIFLITTFIIAPNIQRINTTDLLINFGILLGGGANFFFFWQASGLSSQRQYQLKEKLGTDFVKKLGQSTIVSYL